MNNIFCNKCGNAMVPGEKFCAGCGAPNPGASFQAPSVQPQQPAYTQYPAGYAHKPKAPGYAVALLIISSVLLLGALGFGAWKLFLDKPVAVASKASPLVINTPPVTTPSPTFFTTPEPTPEPTPIPTPEPTAADPYQLFGQVAPDYQNNDRIEKWLTPINVEFEGDYTQEEYAQITSEIVRINDMHMLPEITVVNSGGNFVFTYKLNAEIAQLAGSTSLNYYSYYWYLDSYELKEVDVYISTDQTSQSRIRAALHFLMRGLGFFGDVSNVTGSILQDDQYAFLQNLTDMDFTLLSMLYSPGVECGMTKEEALAALSE